MLIQVNALEVVDGQEVYRIRLTNANGVSADFLTLGATWQAFWVPDGDGVKNLVLGFDRPSDYNRNDLCAGQSIGRVAGRIGGGQFTLDGERIQLPQNNNGNCLHGGPKGFHKQHWTYETARTDDELSVTMTYQARADHDGFPGDMVVTAKFSLSNDNRLSMTYTAHNGDQKTLFNPTTHPYFNLGQTQDLNGHVLQIAADSVLDLRPDLIPTGLRREVLGTPYDFRQGQNLGEAIEASGGFDDAFVVTAAKNNPIAVLRDEVSGDQLSLFSERNALVMYTMATVEEGVSFAKDKGCAAKPCQGVALEAQTLPDAINHDGFGNIVLEPGETATYQIVFAYERV